MNVRAIAIAGGLVLLAGAGVGIHAAVDAQRPKGTDEEQIRRLLFEGERAAEQGRPGGITRFLSKDYRDNLGMSDSSLAYQIRQYLREYQIHEITIPSERVELRVPAGGEIATASFPVRLTAQSREGGSTTREFQLNLALRKEPVYYYWIFPGEEWKVTAAEGYADGV